MKACPTQHVGIVSIDPDPLFHSGFRNFLKEYPCFGTPIETATLREAESILATSSPSIVLLDPLIDGIGGIEFTRRLRNSASAPAFVARLRDYSEDAALAVMEAGANGVLCAREGLEELALALITVACGYSFVSGWAATFLAEAFYNKRISHLRVVSAPPRQLQVFQLLGNGLRPHDIATRLGISLKSVQTHIERLKHRFNLRSQADLVRQATLRSKETA